VCCTIWNVTDTLQTTTNETNIRCRIPLLIDMPYLQPGTAIIWW